MLQPEFEVLLEHTPGEFQNVDREIQKHQHPSIIQEDDCLRSATPRLSVNYLSRPELYVWRKGMKKNYLAGIVSGFVVFMMIFLVISQDSVAGVSNDEKRCETKYPIILVHGLGWKDVGSVVEYFYQIPETLNKNGARAYSANHLSMGGHEQSARSLATVVAEILAVTNSEKVNIIAQSQGGPMVRFLLENLTVPLHDGTNPMACEVVASFTSISCPNKGTPLCDAILGIFPEGGIANAILMGALDAATGFIWNEEGTDSLRAFVETSQKYMKGVFNVENPIVGDSNGGYHNGVYNQSYTGKLTGLTLNAPLFIPTHLLIGAYDGPGTETDGFVSLDSAKFGVSRGIIEGTWWNGGVDHGYEINHFYGMTPGFDAKAFYIDLVEDLKIMGF